MEMLLFIGFWIFLAVIFTLLNSIFGKDVFDMTETFEEDMLVYKKRLSDINNSRNNGTTCSKAGD